MAFSKMKAFLKKVAARTIDDLWQAIAKAIDLFGPNECENYFSAAGYDRDGSNFPLATAILARSGTVSAYLPARAY